MNLLPAFRWCEASPLGEAIRSSRWLFPVIEAFHLVAFAIIGGMILLVDLRLLGVTLKRYPVGDLARETRPFFLGSLVVMLGSGALLFVSESVKCYYSTPFWIKMTALALAIVFTFTVRQRAVNAGGGPWAGRLVAVISLGLWAAVAWGGRWIGFSG